MNTFKSLSQELTSETRVELLGKINGDINSKINIRGSKEQEASVLLTHYYPEENVSKRRCKQTFVRGCQLFNKYQ